MERETERKNAEHNEECKIKIEGNEVKCPRFIGIPQEGSALYETCSADIMNLFHQKCNLHHLHPETSFQALLYFLINFKLGQSLVTINLTETDWLTDAEIRDSHGDSSSCQVSSCCAGFTSAERQRVTVIQ